MFTLSLTMRRAAVTVVLAGAAVFASIGFPSAARASDASYDKMPSSYSAMMKMKPAQVMHMMDAGNKGFVTKEEFMKFHEAMFDKMDKNKDNKLTEEEFIEKTHTGP